MEPTYVSKCGRIKLWLADCRKVEIPRESVVITDPPYGIGKPQLIQQFKNRKTGRYQKTIGSDFGEAFDSVAIQPREWTPLMPDTVVCFYSAKRMAKLILAFKRAGYEIVQDFHWCKKNSPPPLRGIGFAWATESGYIFRRKGTRHVVNKKAGYSPNFFVTPPCHRSERTRWGHCTQKPIGVMKWLIRFLTTKNTLVIDPFMGSGVVGEACAELGRCFMGIEQKEEYFQMAVQRVESGLRRWQESFQLEL